MNYKPPAGYYHGVFTVDFQSWFAVNVAAWYRSRGEVTLFRENYPHISDKLKVRTWSLDGCYDARDIHELVARRARTAAIRIHVTSRPRAKGGPARARTVRIVRDLGIREWNARCGGDGKLNLSKWLRHRREVIRLGLKKWRQRSGYRRRTVIERVFSAMTARFGDSCRSRTDGMRVRDIYVTAVAWNILLMALHMELPRQAFANSKKSRC